MAATNIDLFEMKFSTLNKELVRYADGSMKMAVFKNDKYSLIKAYPFSKEYKKAYYKTKIEFGRDQLELLVERLAQTQTTPQSATHAEVCRDQWQGQTRRLVYTTNEYGGYDIHFEKKIDHLIQRAMEFAESDDEEVAAIELGSTTQTPPETWEPMFGSFILKKTDDISAIVRAIRAFMQEVQPEYTVHRKKEPAKKRKKPTVDDVSDDDVYILVPDHIMYNTYRMCDKYPNSTIRQIYNMHMDELKLGLRQCECDILFRIRELGESQSDLEIKDNIYAQLENLRSILRTRYLQNEEENKK